MSEIKNADTINSNNLQQTIDSQRKMLGELISSAMLELSNLCADIIDQKERMETLIFEHCPKLSYCKHLYVMDASGVQLTDNIKQDGLDPTNFGRDRSNRPYMLDIMENSSVKNFSLSDAYISCNKRRPSLTALHTIRNADNELLGFLGADFDIRELPSSKDAYKEPKEWRQVKGDPAIRGGLFQQTRAESVMDQHIDEVLSLMNELVTQQGIHHGKFHFSSSRCTIWEIDNPLSYRLLTIDELTDPDICLAFPAHVYPEQAIVPQDKIMNVFEMFRELRFADENIYLRAGSLNIINGLVGLNFSCDGSHYIPYDEFLEKNTEFWFGTA